jgi:hypothetical protein
MRAPKGVNALSEKMIVEIVDALQAFDGDPSIRCMALRAGTLKFFSVGVGNCRNSGANVYRRNRRIFLLPAWTKIAQPELSVHAGLAPNCLRMVCDRAGNRAEH